MKTNRLWLLILATSILIPNMVLSQATTPLFQIMTSNSMLDRPPVFQKLDKEIQKTKDADKTGIHINESFTSKIGKMKLEFIELFNAPSLIYDGSLETHKRVTIKWLYGKHIDTISIIHNQDSNEITLSNFENEIIKSIENELVKAMTDRIGTLFKNHEIKDEQAAFIYALLNHIDDVKVEGNNNGAEDLANAIAKHLAKQVRAHLDRNIKEILKKEPEILTYSMDTVIAEICKSVNSKLNEFFKLLESEVLVAFYHAESEINKVIESASDFLVDSNVGLGLSESKGSATPGLVLTSKIGEYLRIGVFAGGSLVTEPLDLGEDLENSNNVGVIDTTITDTSDTSNETESDLLVGLRIQWAWGGYALDALGSVDIKAESNPQVEAGLGASFVYGDLVIGGAYYRHWAGEVSRPAFDIGGLTLKSRTSDSKSVLVGVTYNHRTEDYYPVVQFGFNLSVNGG
ncbi:MAG: hypothetical protein HN356_03445 [Calditrichaeota bacterium]|jgi:hypothetical protein|nr:hypothetical protein [Calditrichota bacterium]MBT7615656.1 hypothetical protein [Calditrichota bacterium]MBT7788428.1 hypothetical protein [Calditrichota bacterium]